MWFEILLVLILFKFKKHPSIFGIRVVSFISEGKLSDAKKAV